MSHGGTITKPLIPYLILLLIFVFVGIIDMLYVDFGIYPPIFMIVSCSVIGSLLWILGRKNT